MSDVAHLGYLQAWDKLAAAYEKIPFEDRTPHKKERTLDQLRGRVARDTPGSALLPLIGAIGGNVAGVSLIPRLRASNPAAALALPLGLGYAGAMVPSYAFKHHINEKAKARADKRYGEGTWDKHGPETSALAQAGEQALALNILPALFAAPEALSAARRADIAPYLQRRAQRMADAGGPPGRRGGGRQPAPRNEPPRRPRDPDARRVDADPGNIEEQIRRLDDDLGPGIPTPEAPPRQGPPPDDELIRHIDLD